MRLSIFLVLYRCISLQIWSNFRNINKQLYAELHFLIPDITTGIQARLKQKLDSIYFLNKRCFYLVCF